MNANHFPDLETIGLAAPPEPPAIVSIFPVVKEMRLIA
jgi:hypothetical protein